MPSCWSVAKWRIPSRDGCHRSLLEKKKKAEVAIRFDPHFLALQCPEVFFYLTGKKRRVEKLLRSPYIAVIVLCTKAINDGCGL